MGTYKGVWFQATKFVVSCHAAVENRHAPLPSSLLPIRPLAAGHEQVSAPSLWGSCSSCGIWVAVSSTLLAEGSGSGIPAQSGSQEAFPDPGGNLISLFSGCYSSSRLRAEVTSCGKLSLPLHVSLAFPTPPISALLLARVSHSICLVGLPKKSPQSQWLTTAEPLLSWFRRPEVLRGGTGCWLRTSSTRGAVAPRRIPPSLPPFMWISSNLTISGCISLLS